MTNLAIISLIFLIAAIVIGFIRNVNVGLVGILLAVILGYGSGSFTGKQILSGWSSSMFLTLAGITLVFSIVQANGSLELLIRKIVNKMGNMVVLVPIVYFAISWIISALGPGLIPTAALVTVLAVPLAHETGFHPILLALIGVHAADAGRFTMLTVEGNLITELLLEQGFTDHIMTGICVSSTILALLMSLIAYLWYKGYRVRVGMGRAVEVEKFTSKQIISLIGMLVMALLILVFKFETSLAAFSVGIVLILLGVGDQKKALSLMPWNTMFLVCGVGVLMNLVIELGGIDLLSDFLASIMSAQTAAALIGLTAGIMSLFSSTLGVVIPTLVPTVGPLISQVGGAVTTMELCAAIGFIASTSGISPMSTAGGLTLGAISSDPEYAEKYTTNKIFIELIAWVAFYLIFCTVVALTGYFHWFAAL
ncbi:MAG: C4-dicarboxylate ABC transporter [Clostridiales bacterium]|nr:C4-dicarboxylate ABC transporter [Clostridiales bacterium]